MLELANVMKAGDCRHQNYFYSTTNHFEIETIKYMHEALLYYLHSNLFTALIDYERI